MLSILAWTNWRTWFHSAKHLYEISDSNFRTQIWRLANQLSFEIFFSNAVQAFQSMLSQGLFQPLPRSCLRSSTKTPTATQCLKSANLRNVPLSIACSSARSAACPRVPHFVFLSLEISLSIAFFPESLMPNAPSIDSHSIPICIRVSFHTRNAVPRRPP